MGVDEAPYSKEKTLAIDAVGRSLRMCLGIMNGAPLKYMWNKADGSPVTSVDYASQVIIHRVISREDRDAVIIGEEDIEEIGPDLKIYDEIRDLVNSAFPEEPPIAADSVNKYLVPDLIQSGSYKRDRGDRFWVVDPIDGTRGFVEGREFSVCLALIENGRVILGVTGCPEIKDGKITEKPVSGHLYVAVKGQGAYKLSMDGKIEERIFVDNSKPLNETIIARSTRAKESLEKVISEIENVLDIKVQNIKMHSQCKYCLISQGAANLYVRILDPPHTKEMIWDHASGSILIEEACGVVTDFDGKPLDFSCGIQLLRNRGIIASSKDTINHVVNITKNISFQ